MSERNGGFASWFREALASRPWVRRSLPGFALLGGSSLAGGCIDYDAYARPDDSVAQPDESEAQMSSIDVQRQLGWNVGDTGDALELASATPYDVEGTTSWASVLDSLARELAPSQPALYPFYVPTLFQSVQAPWGASLRAQLQPMITPSMREAYGRGQALRSLFGDVGFPTDTAIVVDVPGPESVAVAAALADEFDPVYTFDNWPHPRGVVPAHETLAAALYYLPQLARARAARPVPSPPVFVLDANRLAPYGDDDGAFDNRYVARVPPAAALQQLGVRHVLYVTAEPTDVEADDLNADFVAWQAAGIDVRMLALSDFTPTSEPPPVELAPDFPYWQDGGVNWVWGGDYWDHACFWGWYGWYPVRPGRPVHVGAVPAIHVGRGYAWHPASRPTMFTRATALAVGTPTGPRIGRTTVTTSRSTGAMHFAGGGGFTGGRSGSFGRVGGFFGGG